MKICSKFTGEYPCRSVISITLLCNLFNHTSAWVFSCKFAAYFQNLFLISSVESCFCLDYWYDAVRFCELSPWTQDENWTYIRRSDVQNIFWTSYVRSIYVLCLWDRYTSLKMRPLGESKKWKQINTIFVFVKIPVKKII